MKRTNLLIYLGALSTIIGLTLFATDVYLYLKYIFLTLGIILVTIGLIPQK